MGKGFPEEDVAFDLFAALELGKKVQPRKVVWSRCTGGSQYGRYEVDGRTKFRAVRGWDGAFPTEHDGVAGPSLIGAAFGARPIPSVFRLNPAVVRDVNDQGVLRDARLVDMIHQGPTGLVEPFAHGVVLGDPFLNTLGEVLLVQALGRVVGGMRKEGSVPNEEGLLLLDRTVDEVENRFHPFPPDFKPRITVPASGVGESAGHPFGETSALVRSLPPFPALVAPVSLLAQPMRETAMLVYVRDKDFPRIPARSLGVGLVLRSVGRVVAGDLVLVRV